MFLFSIVPDDFSAVSGIWDKIVEVLVSLLSIVIILMAGWIVAIIVGRFAEKILKALSVDKLPEKIGIKEKMERNGIRMSISRIGGEFVKWIIILLMLIGAAEYAGLFQVAQFFNEVLNYVPNIIVAVIILIIGILIANFAYRVSKSSISSAGLASSELISRGVKWTVIIFAVSMALDQLGVQMEFIKILFMGIVAMFAIAGGIAFGLGGRNMAQEALEKARAGMK